MTEGADPADAFASGDPAGVREALADLNRRWRERREIEMPAPEPEVLDVFGARAPSDVVSDYLSVMGTYRAFTPRLSATALAETWVRTQLRHGDSSTALQIALQSRTSPAPELRPAALIEILARQPVDLPDRAVDAAAALVRHLLDSNHSHDETFLALLHSADRGVLTQAVPPNAAWLSSEERAALGLAT